MAYRYRKGRGIVSRCMSRARSSKQRTGNMLDNKDRRTKGQNNSRHNNRITVLDNKDKRTYINFVSLKGYESVDDLFVNN